jgi:hypothetical protein
MSLSVLITFTICACLLLILRLKLDLALVGAFGEKACEPLPAPEGWKLIKLHWLYAGSQSLTCGWRRFLNSHFAMPSVKPVSFSLIPEPRGGVLAPSIAPFTIPVQVVGVPQLFQDLIIRGLVKHSTSLVAAGVTGIRYAFHKDEFSMELEMKQMAVRYAVYKIEAPAQQTLAAIARFETDPNMRPEIREEIVKDLEHLFDGIEGLIRDELAKMK